MSRKRRATLSASQFHVQLDEQWVLRRISESLDLSDYRNSYLVKSLLSKYAAPSKESARARQRAAIAKLLWTSRRNRETEYRLLRRDNKQDFMFLLTREVANLLGDVPEFEGLSSFSGGASTRHRRGKSQPQEKFDGYGDTTASNAPFARKSILASPAWSCNSAVSTGGSLELRLVPGNVVFTVPKSNAIDRAAAKEPDLNMYVQKFYGDHIRNRLRRFGIDLNDQGRNRDLARQGSITGDLATLDLSSASDSITRILMLEVLPPAWFDVLDRSRSRWTNVNGVYRQLHMFSTMGNGFTFELESLLFFAVTRVTLNMLNIQGTIGIYGDDIICPTSAAHEVVSNLEYIGFRTNIDKSFIEGRFRESCGGHYYKGRDVTPFYIRSPLNNIQRIIWLLNKIREWSSEGTTIAVELEELYFEIYNKFSILRFLTGCGGLDSISSLAIPGAFGGYLHQVTRRVAVNEDGAYVQALLKGSPSDTLRLVSVETNRYEIRQWSDKIRSGMCRSLYSNGRMVYFLREVG